MNWNRTEDVQPEDNQTVQTISEGGMEQDLTYYQGLWFTSSDRSMYIYYTPKYWRAL